METSGIDSAADLVLEEEGVERLEGSEFTLGPLVDKIASDIARGLVAAVKELEHHVGGETRRLGEEVERRINSLQIGLHEISGFAEEQRSTNGGVQDQLQQLTAASAALRESDARQEAELEAVRTEARDLSTAVSGRYESTVAALHESHERQAADLAAMRDATGASFQSVAERIDKLCGDLGIHQEDFGATRTNLYSRIDAVVERLDRQADAVRSLHHAYSNRETELEQIADGLARLRAYPRPLLTAEL